MSALPAIPPKERLTPAERSGFLKLEAECRQLQTAFFRFSEIILEIRDHRLYREDWEDFESYLKIRWGISRGRGYQLLGAGATVAILSAPGDDMPATIPMPTRERVTRPIQGLPAPTQRAVWKDAVTTSGDDPTEADVAAALGRVAPELVKPKRPKDDVAKAKAAGIIPADAVVEVTEADDAGPEEEEATAGEPSDSDWLETLSERAHLSDVCRKRFDAQAKLARAAKPLLEALRRGMAPLRKSAHKLTGGHIGPWESRYTRFVGGSDPGDWLACSDCGGTGQVPMIGRCAACKGEGYHV